MTPRAKHRLERPLPSRVVPGLTYLKSITPYEAYMLHATSWFAILALSALLTVPEVVGLLLNGAKPVCGLFTFMFYFGASVFAVTAVHAGNCIGNYTFAVFSESVGIYPRLYLVEFDKDFKISDLRKIRGRIIRLRGSSAIIRIRQGYSGLL